MEPNIVPQQPTPSLPPTPPSDNKRNILIISILVTALVVGFGVYFLSKNNSSQNQVVDNNISTPTSPTNTPATSANNKTYFGKGWEGKYSLINIESGETKSFIPAGYTIVDQHEYEQFPPYLILQKDNDLYSYSLENKITNSIFGTFNDLKLKKNEQARIYPSITEKDKFLLVINEYNPNEEPGMGLPTPLNTRSYSLDASTNKLISIASVKFGGCAEYDSKNQRFFTWPCGEGIGNSTPLSISNLNGKEQREVITQEEFGLSKENIGPVAVQYENGLFFALSKGNVSKVVVLNPQSVNPTKETYTVNEQIKPQITESYPYSVSMDMGRSTIIIGGNNFILLLRFDANKLITQSTYIPDKEIYANFIFVNDGKLYYQAKDNIRVVNLDTWKIEKSIPSPRNEEITLLSIPD